MQLVGHYVLRSGQARIVDKVDLKKPMNPSFLKGVILIAERVGYNDGDPVL